MFDLWADMKSYVGFSARDSEILCAFRPLAQPHFPRIVADFYDRIEEHPTAHAVFTGGPEQIERLRQTLMTWMDSGLAGPHDGSFFEGRAQIGHRHVAIGLPQRYMFTSMNLIRIAFHDIVESELGSQREKATATHKALDRLFDLELAVMLHTYQEDSAALVRRRERVAAARERELQLATLVDTVQALLLVLDDNGLILQANPALSAATGVPTERLICAPWVEQFVHPEDRTPFRHLLSSVHERPFTTTHESRILRRNGSATNEIRWVQWQAAYAEVEDGQRRVYVSGLDVTELRELKRQARVSEKLAAVGTLTAGLAHEIRNPLNGANLQLELLRRRLDGIADNERLQEIVGAVRNEIGRLSRIIEDFLNFASPSDFVRGTFDMADLVRGVAERELGLNPPPEMRMDVDVPDTRIEFQGDRAKLQETVANLIRNAIEAVSARGRVQVRLRTTDEGISLDIVDDGPGISSNNLDRVFEPFFSTKSMGTGLGLSIGHSFIQLHGGRISLQSPASGRDTGTSVSVWLPRTITTNAR